MRSKVFLSLVLLSQNATKMEVTRKLNVMALRDIVGVLINKAVKLQEQDTDLVLLSVKDVSKGLSFSQVVIRRGNRQCSAVFCLSVTLLYII